MSTNGNIALAVRENLTLYLAARPHLRLREIAETCNLSYSGLSKLMATKSIVSALSTDTIDKLSSGLNIPAAWLVVSSGTEMANLSFTGAKRIDEWLVLWAKHLFLGEAGFKVMRDYYAEDYLCIKQKPVAGYDFVKVNTIRRDGYETFGISAQDEFRENHSLDVSLFVILSARIISKHRVILTYESHSKLMTMGGRQSATNTGATCLCFSHPIKEIMQNVPVVPIQLTSNSGARGPVTSVMRESTGW